MTQSQVKLQILDGMANLKPLSVCHPPYSLVNFRHLPAIGNWLAIMIVFWRGSRPQSAIEQLLSVKMKSTFFNESLSHIKKAIIELIKLAAIALRSQGEKNAIAAILLQ